MKIRFNNFTKVLLTSLLALSIVAGAVNVVPTP
jgi:hypothetical protein